jgi:glutathione S-transferase
MPAPLTLYTITGSHSCRVAELMLEHKGLRYRRAVLPAGVHRVVVRLRGFAGPTVPALAIGAERVHGTLAISRALDALAPDPPLFPSDPDGRRAVEEAERRGEEIQNAVRRIFYTAARRRPSIAGDVLGANLNPVGAAALRPVLPLFVRVAGHAHGATDAACQRDLAELPAMLDQVDGWIADGTIGGPQLNAADFQIGACLRPLLFADDLAGLVDGRPWAQHALRIAPDYAGHIPALLPTAWLPPGATVAAAEQEADV